MNLADFPDSRPGEYSTGLGFDAHRFTSSTQDRPLWLACLPWEEDLPGIEGDSDGDVAAHALIDAMLSAANLGDIGTLFGVGPRSQGAGMHGADMLRKTADVLHDHEWRVVSASVLIITQLPRLSLKRRQAQAAMSEAIGAQVALTGTTTDGLGFTGRGEGIAAMSSVLAVRIPRGETYKQVGGNQG